MDVKVKFLGWEARSAFCFLMWQPSLCSFCHSTRCVLMSFSLGIRIHVTDLRSQPRHFLALSARVMNGLGTIPIVSTQHHLISVSHQTDPDCQT